MKHEEWMPHNWIRHTEIEIELGQSRYGGPVIDIPEGMVIPDNLQFAAQLDLKAFAPHDKTGLLPKSGHLYFFADIYTDTGKVFYADISNDSLLRITREHEEQFFTGVLIDKVFADTEKWEERFREPVDQWDNEHKNENGKLWDYFAGSEKSKLFGIYTHCQYSEKEIEDITSSDKVLLLQVGEDGFNDEGVFSVLIPKSDLVNLNFDNCSFAWGQS